MKLQHKRCYRSLAIIRTIDLRGKMSECKCHKYLENKNFLTAVIVLPFLKHERWFALNISRPISVISCLCVLLKRMVDVLLRLYLKTKFLFSHSVTAIKFD